MAATVTIDKVYFETLLRRCVCLPFSFIMELLSFILTTFLELNLLVAFTGHTSKAVTLEMLTSLVGCIWNRSDYSGGPAHGQHSQGGS